MRNTGRKENLISVFLLSLLKPYSSIFVFQKLAAAVTLL